MNVAVLATPALSGLERATLQPDDWQELDACTVCASRELVRLGGVEGSERAAVTAACTACGHVFHRRRPRDSWFDAYYAASWDRRGRTATTTKTSKVRADDKVLRFCAEHLPDRARVLEIGAGFGSQLLAFQRAGHEPHGLERSAHRAAFVFDELGIPCAMGAFERLDFDEGFDLVFSHHVLEHLSDPAAAIGKSVSLLRAGGRVYVAVPNMWAELAPQSFHFVPHVSLFTLASLTTLLARHGLRVIARHEDRELQVLAIRDASAEPAAPPESFAARAGIWATAPFGGIGRHDLIWRKAHRHDAFYDLDVRPPRRLARRRSDAWRALRVEVFGSSRAPVDVRHNVEGAPVWIK